MQASSPLDLQNIIAIWLAHFPCDWVGKRHGFINRIYCGSHSAAGVSGSHNLMTENALWKETIICLLCCGRPRTKEITRDFCFPYILPCMSLWWAILTSGELIFCHSSTCSDMGRAGWTETATWGPAPCCHLEVAQKQTAGECPDFCWCLPGTAIDPRNMKAT